ETSTRTGLLIGGTLTLPPFNVRRHCSRQPTYAIFWSGNVVSFTTHAQPLTKSAHRFPGPLPVSVGGSRGDLYREGPARRQLPRRQLVECRHASAGERRRRGAPPRLHRPHRPLEGRLLGAQLDRVEARECHVLEPLRRGGLG